MKQGDSLKQNESASTNRVQDYCHKNEDKKQGHKLGNNYRYKKKVSPTKLLGTIKEKSERKKSTSAPDESPIQKFRKNIIIQDLKGSRISNSMNPTPVNADSDHDTKLNGSSDTSMIIADQH